MSDWYLCTINVKATQLITYRARALGAEVFSPTKIKVTKRADCNGVRTTETQLFPGYLFLKLDLDIVHTSDILKIVGVNGFVSFGGKISTISDSLIGAIKASLLVKPDKAVANIEYRNITQVMLEKLERVMQIKSLLDRRVELFKLLQSESHILNCGNSTVASVIDRPYVNDLIS